MVSSLTDPWVDSDVCRALRSAKWWISEYQVTSHRHGTRTYGAYTPVWSKLHFQRRSMQLSWYKTRKEWLKHISWEGLDWPRSRGGGQQIERRNEGTSMQRSVPRTKGQHTTRYEWTSAERLEWFWPARLDIWTTSRKSGPNRRAGSERWRGWCTCLR